MSLGPLGDYAHLKEDSPMTDWPKQGARPKTIPSSRLLEQQLLLCGFWRSATESTAQRVVPADEGGQGDGGYLYEITILFFQIYLSTSIDFSSLPLS